MWVGGFGFYYKAGGFYVTSWFFFYELNIFGYWPL